MIGLLQGMGESMTLTKDRLVEVIRQRSQFSAQEAKKMVEILLEAMKAKLEDGDEVKISGFGKWAGRNPHTGDKIQIAARRVVTFHPSEKLRDSVNDSNLRDDQMTLVGPGGKMDDDDE
jgi:integration host factor subunit alpha